MDAQVSLDALIIHPDTCRTEWITHTVSYRVKFLFLLLLLFEANLLKILIALRWKPTKSKIYKARKKGE